MEINPVYKGTGGMPYNSPQGVAYREAHYRLSLQCGHDKPDSTEVYVLASRLLVEACDFPQDVDSEGKLTHAEPALRGGAVMTFSIGEWVERKYDGATGVVVKTDVYDGHPIYYVDTDPGREGEDTVWAGTDEAWQRLYRTHAHMSSRSADCDGTYSSGHVYEMTLEERCDEFGDLHFQNRVVSNTISLHGHGKLDVTPDGVEWYEETEEGYREATVRWCNDECPSETSWRRDHRAEAAGY